MGDKTEKAHGIKRFIEEYKRLDKEWNDSHSGPGYGEWRLRNTGPSIATAIVAIENIIKENRSEKKHRNKLLKKTSFCPPKRPRKLS